MSTSRRTKRFVAAFGIAVAVVGVAVAVRGSGSSDTAGSSPATSTTVASTGTSTTEAPATTVAPTTTAPAPTTTMPPLGTLPMLDIAAECVSLFGDGAEPIAAEIGPPTACRSTDGEERPFDADSACEARQGIGLLSVKVINESGGDWKCQSADRIELGQPDWQGECERAYGANAVAFVYQSNSSGWACASVENGIYLELPVELDQACHVAYGPDTFGIAGRAEDGGTPEDNICYGAAP